MTAAEYKKSREQLRLTQAGLAALLGVPRTSISRRESGKLNISDEAALAIRQLLASQNAESRHADEDA